MNRALSSLRTSGQLERIQQTWLAQGGRGTGPPLEPAPVARRSRILDLGDGRRGVAIAVVSTILVFGALVLLVTHAPGWPEVKKTFFDWDVFKASFPEIARAFKLNVKIFCIAEVLDPRRSRSLLAVLRSLPGPVFFPLRVIAIVYADFFRGVPTILVIAVLGFGAPALAAAGRADVDDVLGHRRARARLHRVRLRGLPRRHRVRASEPGGRGALARADALPGTAPRDPAAGRAPRDPAAPQRLHRPAEGHRARRLSRRDRGVQPVADRRRRDLQLHAVPRGRRAVRRHHDPARALHRLADPARPAPAPGRRRRRLDSSARSRRRSQVVRQARGAARHRPHRRRARGRLPDRRIGLGQVDAAPLRQPDRADRRRAHLRRRARRSPHAASTRTASGAASGSSTRRTTSSRTCRCCATSRSRRRRC